MEKAKSAPPRASPTLLFYLIIFFKKKKKQKQWEDWKGNTFPAFFFTLAVGYTCCVLYVFFYSFRRTQYDSCRFFGQYDIYIHIDLAISVCRVRDVWLPI